MTASKQWRFELEVPRRLPPEVRFTGAYPFRTACEAAFLFEETSAQRLAFPALKRFGRLRGGLPLAPIFDAAHKKGLDRGRGAQVPATLGVVRLHDDTSGQTVEFAILVRSRLKDHGVGC
jgi:hypothetical protein